MASTVGNIYMINNAYLYARSVVRDTTKPKWVATNTQLSISFIEEFFAANQLGSGLFQCTAADTTADVADMWQVEIGGNDYEQTQTTSRTVGTFTPINQGGALGSILLPTAVRYIDTSVAEKDKVFIEIAEDQDLVTATIATLIGLNTGCCVVKYGQAGATVTQAGLGLAISGFNSSTGATIFSIDTGVTATGISTVSAANGGAISVAMDGNVCVIPIGSIATGGGAVTAGGTVNLVAGVLNTAAGRKAAQVLAVNTIVAVLKVQFDEAA